MKTEEPGVPFIDMTEEEVFLVPKPTKEEPVEEESAVDSKV